MLTHASRAAVLARAGLVPGPDGYDLEQLERCAQARGWSWTTVESATSRRGKWRASVSVPVEGMHRHGGGRLCSQARGATEAAALAMALATALAREE